LKTAWTQERLADLPAKDGVRLRGVEITRLETFCDAAFAFAVTLLVIGGGGVPDSYNQLVVAMKGIPAFAGSFSLIAWFWWSHRTWSRRYGLEDGQTVLLSLAFVFVMLIYVYPLRMIFSAFGDWASAGWLPTQFVIDTPKDMIGIFVIYGVGFAAQTGCLALLHRHVLKMRDQLGLDEVERVRTRQSMAENLVLGATGVASAVWALALPLRVGIYAGFVYAILPIAMPLLASIFNRRATTAEERIRS